MFALSEGVSALEGSLVALKMEGGKYYNYHYYYFYYYFHYYYYHYYYYYYYYYCRYYDFY